MKSSELVDKILRSLGQHEDVLPSIREGNEQTKTTLITFHALFPTILLPALDVLDRRLVTRLLSSTNGGSTATPGTASDQTSNQGRPNLAKRDDGPFVYYVRTAASDLSSSRGRFTNRHGDSSVSYEVRTTAWSCTCAAFTYAVFHPTNATFDHPPSTPLTGRVEAGVSSEMGWGGLLQPYGGDNVPICKHLLACVLAERWTKAGQMIEVKHVGQEEVAGWAAGWGE